MNDTRTISTFANQKDNEPARGETTWDQLGHALGTPRASACTTENCAHGKCEFKFGLAWSPAYWPPGARRAAHSVEGVSYLVIDMDHIKTNEDLGAIYARIAAWKHIIHASHSDRVGDRCVRVVIALSRPVLASEFARFRRAAIEMLDAPQDAATTDASRIYFAPTRPADACGPAFDGTGYLFAQGEGKVLNVDAILAAAVDSPEYASDYTGPREIPDFKGAPPVADQERAARAIAGHLASGARHLGHMFLSGGLARAGWPVENIAEFLYLVAEFQETGNGDYPRRLTFAQTSVNKVRAGENVKGWPSLLEIIGEEAVRTAREALGLVPKRDETFSEQMAKEAQDIVAKKKQAADQAVEDARAEVRATPAVVTPPPPAATTPAPSGVDLDTTLESAQKTLKKRNDPDALRDAEYLKRVNHGAFLTDDPNEDIRTPLCNAALAVVRAAPPGTTPEQIQRKLLASAGTLTGDLPKIIEAAMRVSVGLPPLLARGAPRVVGADLPLDELVLQRSGPRAGSPDGKQHNISVAFRRLGVELRYNELSGREILARDGRRVDLEDHHVGSLFLEVERSFDVQPTDTYFAKVITDIARKNSYHPVRDYLDSLPEDVEITDLLDTWLVRFAGAPDTPFVRAISRIVLVAAVRRVRSPGCKFDEMLILETPVQGRFKSSALKALAVDEDWFNDSFELNDDDKKMIEQTQGKWIIEAGELAGMTKGDHNKFKKWLSKTRDRARMSYDRRPTEVSRQFIVIGTTNDDQYLKDQTGNRRYWPVLVQEFDVAALKAARNQIWAEASRLERENPADEYIRLDPSLYAAAGVEQNKRRAQDSFEIVLNDMIGSLNGRIRIQEVWKLLGFHDDRLPQKGEPNAVAAALKLIGFEHSNTRSVRGIRGTYYERGEGAERDILLSVIGHVGGYKVKADAVMLGPSAPPALGVRPPANEAN